MLEFGHCGDTVAHCRGGCDPRVSAPNACSNGETSSVHYNFHLTILVPICEDLEIKAFDRTAWSRVTQKPEDYDGSLSIRYSEFFLTSL